ncbi:hypothetical protein FA95DRAFT_1607269 [Auriscalpium vulgare]|uniref:Uncharacterized protein n=1 Tax=Auriscalpium vulgare TaxID=40419 RepID=A0ACB8RNZ0_9AGAM|nr:hypothetical protein FA95DRAFT_1607269 [Auriscalpium vulgare]
MPMLDTFTSVPTADPVVPHLGTYIFLTLDPEASVEALHDPVATEQARELPTKTYVGTVCDIIDLPIPDRRYHKCGIFLLSRGLPVAKPEQGLDEAMCVAIHPSAHPTGRVEIAAPKIPFPWDDLYHHAEGSIEVRLGQGGYEFSTCPSISLDDVVDALVALDDDHYRSVELRRNYEAAHPPPPLAVTTEPFSPPPTSDSDHASFSEVEEEPASPISPGPVTVNKDKLARAESQGTELDLPDVLLKIGRNLMGQDLEDSRDVLVPIARYSTNWTNPPTHELHDGELMAAEIKAIQRSVTLVSILSTSLKEV